MTSFSSAITTLPPYAGFAAPAGACVADPPVGAPPAQAPRITAKIVSVASVRAYRPMPILLRERGFRRIRPAPAMRFTFSTPWMPGIGKPRPTGRGFVLERSGAGLELGLVPSPLLDDDPVPALAAGARQEPEGGPARTRLPDHPGLVDGADRRGGVGPLHGADRLHGVDRGDRHRPGHTRVAAARGKEAAEPAGEDRSEEADQRREGDRIADRRRAEP